MDWLSCTQVVAEVLTVARISMTGPVHSHVLLGSSSRLDGKGLNSAVVHVNTSDGPLDPHGHDLKPWAIVLTRGAQVPIACAVRDGAGASSTICCHISAC